MDNKIIEVFGYCYENEKIYLYFLIIPYGLFSWCDKVLNVIIIMDLSSILDYL